VTIDNVLNRMMLLFSKLLFTFIVINMSFLRRQWDWSIIR